MVDLKDVRENPDKYRRGAELKRVAVDVDAILAIDERRRQHLQAFERARAEQNAAGKDIGKLRDPAEKRAAIERVGALKETVQREDAAARAAEAELTPLLLAVPQPPDDDVPVGTDASQNVVVRTWGEPRRFDFVPLSHVELGERHGLFDFKRGASIAGTRSYFLTGAGAELHNAVMRFALDLITREHGFTAMNVPVLVRESAMQGTGFFPTGREQAYEVGHWMMGVEETYSTQSGVPIISLPDEPEFVTDGFLTGTAEVSLTAFHADEVLAEADLPKKYAAVSTCFRREAGAAGKDTAGLYRVHQFDKCEQVVICRADAAESRRWHLEMLGYSEDLLRRLGQPYRVIACCTGDLGAKNAAMFDVETWMPSRANAADPASGYGETHSASRLYDYQSRRLNLRYKDAEGKLRFCHTLNNTVVASPRVLIPILENGQNADGSVTVPEPLRPYLHGRERIG